MSDKSVKHSPEPWRLLAENGSPWAIEASNGTAVGQADQTVSVRVDPRQSERTANARRIVAAVNAVAGIPTEALESGALGKALDLLMKAQSFASGISIASSVDTTEWDFHRLAGGHLREELYAALRALGRI